MDERDGDRAALAQDRKEPETLIAAAGLAEHVSVMLTRSPNVTPSIARPFETEVSTERLIEALCARLLGTHSATAMLETWCSERGLARDPQLVAERISEPDRPPNAIQRARLAIGPNEPWRYRRVRLICAGLILSEAENWYVPARLTPAMNDLLDATQSPFGRVVHPLAPSRRHLSLIRLWRSSNQERPGASTPLFRVEALISTGSGLPFCEVAETYTGALLALGRR